MCSIIGNSKCTVAPHAGAWIETRPGLPRGQPAPDVAPHAGAWIETPLQDGGAAHFKVAPHAGAWIETSYSAMPVGTSEVAPHAGAWIETQSVTPEESDAQAVAPHAGAWIETSTRSTRARVRPSRAPRGRVD